MTSGLFFFICLVVQEPITNLSHMLQHIYFMPIYNSHMPKYIGSIFSSYWKHHFWSFLETCSRLVWMLSMTEFSLLYRLWLVFFFFLGSLLFLLEHILQRLLRNGAPEVTWSLAFLKWSLSAPLPNSLGTEVWAEIYFSIKILKVLFY